ncbi:type VII secretion protein EccCa [Micromonospora echinaurantiaca]|uniref:type VII secretion protein EccCa n=1 Tax=Micromonospora echinaurantiaca TaxID=47857 RepID=UPI00379361F0
MGVVFVRRPPRRPAPPVPDGEVVLEPPPELPHATNRSWAQMLMILPMVAGSMAMATLFSATTGGTLTYVVGGMFGVSVLGMLATQIMGQPGTGGGALRPARHRYLRYLGQTRKQLRATALEQRAALVYRHPDPADLWTLVDSDRLWERRPADDDFLIARIGIGVQTIATPLVPPQTRPVEDLDPTCAVELRSLVRDYSHLPGMPVALALRSFAHVHLQGATDRARALLRAVLAQVCTLQAPGDVLVAVCAGEMMPEWDWVKWLPHAHHPSRTDAVGPVRLMAPTVAALEAMIGDVVGNRPRWNPNTIAYGVPHLLVVLDGGDPSGSDLLLTEGGVDGITVLELGGAPPRILNRSQLVLHCNPDGELTGSTLDGDTKVGAADGLEHGTAEAVARQLAPMRLTGASSAPGAEPLSRSVDLPALLGVADPEGLDLPRLRAPRPSRDHLRVPIGIGPDGTPVELDLKESAQDGMGPHGLLVGATGSGKSELLRTLVLGLAVTHDSEALNFVLVDFKGGATFTRLDRLPHTSAVITNLADALPLVDRMGAAISGELIRRQELLRAAGNYASQRDYMRARAAGAPLPALPSLLIVCDEFSELLSAKPDFVDMFVQIGRVGRSLGVHLLLASQRLEEGRLRGLDTHLSYRIGLRTFSAMESRAVLGVPDAYELPRAPGHGYLKSGTDGLLRFRAAYVSGALRRRKAVATATVREGKLAVAYSSQYVAPQARPVAPDTAGFGESVLDVMVDQLQGRGASAHQVWLPPLEVPPTLDQLLSPLTADDTRGYGASGTAAGGLRAVAGIVDKPFEQRRDILALDLSGAAGNVIVVGGQRSGKSNLLRTLVLGLALLRTPREAQFYILDFGGGGFGALADLPHVGGVADRRQTERVRRTVAEVTALLGVRERRFAEEGMDGMAAYRAAGLADVFLVIDGWATVRAEFEDLETAVVELATRGLGYGIHVIASAGRWMDVRPAERDVFGSRIELRLGDPADSMISRRAAVNVPEFAPGHGLAPDGSSFLAALPRADASASVEDLTAATARLVKIINSHWSGPPAPAVRVLPAQLRAESLPPAEKSRIPIGIGEWDLQPFSVDFATDPHLLAFGDVESGKSSLLRTIASGVVQAYSPAEARILLVDYRRTLLGVVPAEHLIAYGTSAQVTQDIIAEVATAMRERLPGPDVTSEQLRDRSWWKGPELFVLIDDLDLVLSPSEPLNPLIEFLSQARDIGLHVVAVRRTGGAARAMYHPLIARIRELASPGILLSGNREEGALFGTLKPEPMPPGRAWFVDRRRGARRIQLAWQPPAG